jgi:hypothetical protein
MWSLCHLLVRVIDGPEVDPPYATYRLLATLFGRAVISATALTFSAPS